METKDKIIKLQDEIITRKCNHSFNCWINQNWDEARMAMADTPNEFQDAGYYEALQEIERKSQTCSCGLDNLYSELSRLKDETAEQSSDKLTAEDILQTNDIETIVAILTQEGKYQMANDLIRKWDNLILHYSQFIGEKVTDEMIEAFEDKVSKKRKGYYCSICHDNPVDAENGYDTCQECLSKQ